MVISICVSLPHLCFFYHQPRCATVFGVGRFATSSRSSPGQFNSWVSVFGLTARGFPVGLCLTGVGLPLGFASWAARFCLTASVELSRLAVGVLGHADRRFDEVGWWCVVVLWTDDWVVVVAVSLKRCAAVFWAAVT